MGVTLDLGRMSEDALWGVLWGRIAEARDMTCGGESWRRIVATLDQAQLVREELHRRSLQRSLPWDAA